MPGESNVPVRWQRFAGGLWIDFSTGNTIKIERLFKKGDKARSRYLRLWDGGLEREIDFWLMKIIPGQGKLRRIGPPMSVPGRPQFADITVPPSWSNQLDLSVDGEGLLGSAAGRAKPKRVQSAPVRRSAPKGRAIVPVAASGSQAGAGTTAEFVELTEDLTKLNVAHELQRLSHPDFAKMEEVQFEFKDIPKSRYARKAERDLENLTFDIATLAVEYGQCLKEGEPLILKSSPHHAMAALSMALHMAGPFKEPARVSPVHQAPPSVVSSSSSLSLQGHPGKALMNFLSFKSRRPASAPARSRSDVVPNPLVDSSPELPMPSMHAGNLLELPTRIVFRVGRDSADVRQIARRLRDAWREWKELSCCRQKPDLHPLHPCLSNGSRSFAWVTMANSLPRCLDRLQCFLDTQCCARELKSSGCVAEEIQFLRHSESRPRSALRPGKSSLDLKKTQLSALSQAVICSSAGRRAAAVVICSPFEAGGQCFTGRSAVGEEEACLRSTFYLSMREAARQVRLRHLSDSCSEMPHIPEDGAVLCRKVLVLREDAGKGFAPYQTPIEVAAVIAVGMPTVKGDKASLAGVMKNKINTILKAANELQVQFLVLTDEGAGPHAAAWASATASCLDLVSKARSPLPEVFFAGSTDYFYIARRMEGTLSEW